MLSGYRRWKPIPCPFSDSQINAPRYSKYFFLEIHDCFAKVVFFGNCAPWIPWIKGSGDNQTFNIQSSIQQLKLRGGSIVVSISFSMGPRFPARRFGSLIVNIAQTFCSTHAQYRYPVAVWHHFLVSKC